jgi:hypothetical protein
MITLTVIPDFNLFKTSFSKFNGNASGQIVVMMSEKK